MDATECAALDSVPGLRVERAPPARPHLVVQVETPLGVPADAVLCDPTRPIKVGCGAQAEGKRHSLSCCVVHSGPPPQPRGERLTANRAPA